MTPIIACELVKYCNILRFEFTVQRHKREREREKERERERERERKREEEESNYSFITSMCFNSEPNS